MSFGNVFYVKIYIFWNFIQYTIHWDNTSIKRVSFWQNKRYKNTSFFHSRAPTHHSLTFNSWFCYELKRKVHLFKYVWDFPFSVLSRFDLSFNFCSITSMDKLKIIEKPHTFLLPDLRLLSCNNKFLNLGN